jgi:hypothetical protein
VPALGAIVEAAPALRSDPATNTTVTAGKVAKGQINALAKMLSALRR